MVATWEINIVPLCLKMFLAIHTVLSGQFRTFALSQHFFNICGQQFSYQAAAIMNLISASCATVFREISAVHNIVLPGCVASSQSICVDRSPIVQFNSSSPSCTQFNMPACVTQFLVNDESIVCHIGIGICSHCGTP